MPHRAEKIKETADSSGPQPVAILEMPLLAVDYAYFVRGFRAPWLCSLVQASARCFHDRWSGAVIAAYLERNVVPRHGRNFRVRVKTLP
jgi:hypothetical protein